MSKSNFSKSARTIQQALLTSSKRALGKAITKTKSKVKKDLRQQTGLSSEIVNSRVNSFKPKGNRLRGSVNMATKFDIGLEKFKPKEKKVKRNKRTYFGVTTKIGRQPRSLVPTGFLRTVKSGKELVLARKDQSNSKSKLKRLKTDMFKQTAKSLQKSATRYLREEFITQSKTELDLELTKRLNKIK